MLLALEAKQRLVELLTAYVDGRQQEVRVVVGLDDASPAMQDLVLIARPPGWAAPAWALSPSLPPPAFNIRR